MKNVIESLQDLNDIANNDKSIPNRHRNSIPVSVSSPSFGVSHKSVGFRQKLSPIDELSRKKMKFDYLQKGLYENNFFSLMMTNFPNAEDYILSI